MTMALETLPEKMRQKQFGALAHFRSTKSLGWIEAHASESTSEAWGYLAAASKFNWPKGEEWLKAGRPLSLIAVDALLAIANPRTPFLRRIGPVLENQPSEQGLRYAVEALMKADPAPRVMQRARALLENVPALIRSS
ncbi:hypothetical protein [Janthinobacterium sp. BJB426]|uniref:hypothetical protein n=1 Tax=Janthinobacterium sp. BJB426 TaxID=2048010 RepID=UPI001F293783|nr:hypothetical protein [Janthinobacterium sp. BJB426]